MKKDLFEITKKIESIIVDNKLSIFEAETILHLIQEHIDYYKGNIILSSSLVE